MGILDLYAAQAGSIEPPLQGLPRTPGERFGAAFDAAQAPDRYFNIEGARRDWYGKVIDELHAETGKRLANPLDPPTPEELFKGGVAVPPVQIRANRQQAIVEANRALRETKPEALNAENIDRYIGLAGDRARGLAASYEGSGNGLAAFAGGAAGDTLSPHGLVGLMVPVTRLPTAAATAIGETFMANVLKEGAFQAGANMGVTAGAEALDYAARRATGTAPHGAEIAATIGMAGMLGFGIGAGARALHLKWLGLPEKVREAAPLEVRDAFRVIEADALYSGQNRLGVDPLLHERYQGRTNDAILRGTAPSLDDLGRAADTPLTALGTILRAEPRDIRVEGLTDALGRARALPDSELEPFARQAKPQSFAQLDAVDAKLAELDRRVASIHEEAQQIGLADVADIDTAARLQDIDARLQAKGLRRQARADLERERGQIVESIDRDGRLTAELQLVRRDFFPDHAKALKEIEQERAALMRERQAAQSVAQGEIDFLRARLDKLDRLATRRPYRIDDPIAAYHGSPSLHDRFDPKFIGSGENTTMEGRGFYFGSHPGVMDKNSGYTRKAVTDIEDLGKHRSPGYGYEVRLHVKPGELLQWDLPLAQQPRPVRELARRFGIDDPKATGEEIYRGIVDAYQRRELAKLSPEELDKLVGEPGRVLMVKLEREAQAMIAEAAPGARYTSRGALKDENFVIYAGHEGRIEIVRRANATTGEHIPMAHEVAAAEMGFSSPEELAQAIQRAEALRQARLVRDILPEGRPAPPEPAPTKAAEALTPEHLAALDTATARVMETPGSLGDHKAAMTRELGVADTALKDARAAAACAMGAI